MLGIVKSFQFKIRMLKQAFLYLIILISYPISFKSDQDFNSDDYEILGPTLAANDRLIIAVQNRIGMTFSAVFNYISSSPEYCSVSHIPPSGTQLYVTMVALQSIGSTSSSNNKFVFAAYSILDRKGFLYIASIDFTTCSLTILKETLLFNSSTTYPSYSVLGVNSDGTIAIYLSDTNVFIQSLTASYPSSVWTPFSISSSRITIPMAIDLQGNWGVLAVYSRSNTLFSTFQAALYRLNFANCFTSQNITCLNFLGFTSVNYLASWQLQITPPNLMTSYTYNSLYDMSLAINGNNQLIFGVQLMNTVFRFQINSNSFTLINQRYLSTTPGTGFGKGVGWLDNTSVAILANNFTTDYIQWYSSIIQLYPINASDSLSNTIPPYASYPDDRQTIWSGLKARLVNMLAVIATDALIYMDYVGKVHVILPSDTGSYVYTESGIGETNNSIYIASNLPCSSGTIKSIFAYGENLFRYCVLCPEGSFYSVNSSNSTNVCTPCDETLYFCPWGAVKALPRSVLNTYSQAQVYPQTPDNDVFEDILLMNMFYLDFSDACLLNQPVFFALIIMGVGCLFLVFMGILKLFKKCRKGRRIMKKFFKQTDLIGEGELWIGGVTSFAILVIAIYAYRFSAAFINQYPIEIATNATFACDPTLRNSKFSTSMESLGVPLLDSEQPIFDMLNNQSFTLNVIFINTDFRTNQLNVSQVIGSIFLDLPKQTTSTEGLLTVSVNLTSHSTTVNFNVSSTSAVGAFRVGLSGPSVSNNNYFVQELNFSSAFYYPNRTLTQNPTITVELIKLINVTEPLSDGGETLYSALWVPIFIKNDDQLFYSSSEFQEYHVEDNTVLSIKITEATYYIYNHQEPITKISEMIFTDIIFTTMCIELFALTFLFYKLALSPLIQALLRLCIKPKEVTPKSNGTGCPYCQSIDAETLPANRVPIQRAIGETPNHPIRRQDADIYKLQLMSASPNSYS